MAQITTPRLSLKGFPNSTAGAFRISDSYMMIVTSNLRFYQIDSIFNNPFQNNPGWIFGNNFTYTVELWKQKIDFLAQIGDPNKITYALLASSAVIVRPTAKNFQGLIIKKKTEFLTSSVFPFQLISIPGESVFGMIRLVNNSNGATISVSTDLKPV